MQRFISHFPPLLSDADSNPLPLPTRLRKSPFPQRRPNSVPQLLRVHTRLVPRFHHRHHKLLRRRQICNRDDNRRLPVKTPATP